LTKFFDRLLEIADRRTIQLTDRDERITAAARVATAIIEIIIEMISAKLKHHWRARIAAEQYMA